MAEDSGVAPPADDSGMPSARAASIGLLERARRGRLLEIGVSEEAINESVLTCLPERKGPRTFRVMQWNLLADGLSDDGFLTRPVLADWPAGFGHMPTSDGTPVEFSTLCQEMVAGRGDEKALHALKMKYVVPAAAANAKAVVDKAARMLQIELKVLAMGSPDVLVFQELDHYAALADGLEALGYTSEVPNAGGYVPAHIMGLDTRDVDTFDREWGKQGHAFFPDGGSNSMRLTLAARGYLHAVCDAAAGLGLTDKIVDSSSGTAKFKQDAFIGIPGGSAALLQAAGIDDPLHIDDMGTAVFWRTDRFDAESMEVQSFPKGKGGCIQVNLVHRRGRPKAKKSKKGPAEPTECCKVSIVGTHLSSGHGPKDEEKRLSTQVDVKGGLRQLCAHARAHGEPLVLCLDANSHPQARAPDGESSVWRSLQAAIGASVWDKYFTAKGNFKVEGNFDGGLEPPVSSNKVRGPLSGQAKKIGLHAYYLIDHVYYVPEVFEFRQHVLPPQRFMSAERALEFVQPSLSNPSDHYPVVVDLAWLPPRPPPSAQLAKLEPIGPAACKATARSVAVTLGVALTRMCLAHVGCISA